MPSQDVGHILKKEHTRTYASDGINKYRKTVAGILYALLIAKTAERLAGRPTNDNTNFVGFRIVKANLKELIVASALQISIIGVNSGLYHLIANGEKASRLKAQRQSSTAGKEVEDYGFFADDG